MFLLCQLAEESILSALRSRLLHSRALFHPPALSRASAAPCCHPPVACRVKKQEKERLQGLDAEEGEKKEKK